MTRNWNSSVTTQTASLKPEQADADAEWMLENIMHRFNWTAEVRDNMAWYISLIVTDAQRGGKIKPRTRKGRRNR